MTKSKKARAIGFNHVALEVGDIDEALEFYGKFIDFELRSKSESQAFIDLGDQFLALQRGRRPADAGPLQGAHIRRQPRATRHRAPHADRGGPAGRQ